MKKSIRKMTLAVTALALVSNVALTSCKKEGPAGPAGTNGKDGVANIKASTVTTNNLNWVFDNSDNSYNATINYDAITSDVIQKGTVQVFLGDGSGDEWFAMPFSYGIVQYNYSVAAGKVYIFVTLSNGNVPNNPGGQQFKVVAIPPAMVKQNVNTNSYEEMKAAYNLAD